MRDEDSDAAGRETGEAPHVDELRIVNQRLVAENAALKERIATAERDNVSQRESRRAALNLMEDVVQARRAEQREIVERRRVEDELLQSHRRKDEFLATLAHELRNPLAPIRNSLEILRLGGHDSGAVMRVQAMLERQINHMVRLVDDLMEVSRITRGKIVLRKEEVTIATIVRTAVELSMPLIDSARHQLAINLPAEPLIVSADPTRLAQVLANLLNNAAKYSDPGGQIWVTARREESQVVISVRDSGEGIPIEMLSRVFDLFTQVDRTLGRAQGGLGIGLALVQRLVEAHGGRVEALSEGIGKGSEFVVRIPLLNSEVPNSSPVTKERSSVLDSMGRILIVDDNRDAAESTEMLLKLLGIETAIVDSGYAALEILHSYQPQVILLDIGMPEMDGNEVARRIRSHSEFNGTTLIALTGWGQEEDRRRCKQAGFDFHLVKPVELATLEELLQTITQNRLEVQRTAATTRAHPTQNGTS